MTNLPAFLVGVIVAIYWARVLKMMRKSKRRVGRMANIIPTEPVGILTRAVWAPVVGLWITLPILAGFGLPRGRGLQPVWDQPWVGWIALAVAACAFAFTLVCWKRMGRSWRMGIDSNEKTPLVVSGPYAYVRHPIYALSTVLMLATLAACPTPAMLAVALVHLALLQIEIRREEAYLTKIHGATYLDYCRAVGRFFPHLF